MKRYDLFFRSAAALLIATLFAFPVAAQQQRRSANLATEPFSWRLVIGGRAVGTICDTSYGFAFLSDGRTICAVGKDGRFLWQRSVRGVPSPYLSHMDDILLVVTAKDTLNLMNPSGLVLWSAKTGFDITENPLAGRDGRVFVRGKDAVACYGLQGGRKWLVRPGQLRDDLALAELDDGSLLAFLETTSDNGNTQAARISPFGAVLETVTFSGFVQAAAGCPSGVLVALSSGAGGLCAVADDVAVSRWHTTEIGNCQQLAVFADGRTGVFLSQSGSEAVATLIDLANGEPQEQLALGALKLSAANQLRTTARGIYISDGARAVEFSAGAAFVEDDVEEGTAPAVLWEAALPPASDTAATFYTADGTLLICRKDWVIQAYVMADGDTTEKPVEAPITPKSYQPQQQAHGTRAETAAVDRISANQLSTIRRALAAGDYGPREQAWSAKVQLELQNWLLDLSQMPRGQQTASSYYFEDNPVYARAIIDCAVDFATADYTPLLAALIANESRTPVCTDILRAYTRLAWDVDGVMLSTLEELLQRHRFTARDTAALRAICDAVYETCRRMGKPALMAKGRIILAYLLYPQFDASTRDYARKTFQRIAALQMP